MKFASLILCSLVSIAQGEDNRYIITFKKSEAGASVAASTAANTNSFESNVDSITNLFTAYSTSNNILHKYDTILSGIAATLDNSTLAKVKALPNVESVEEDGIAHALAVQNNAPWGLARISHRNRLDNSNYQKYEYSPNAGEGTTVYVVDSGININHEDFGGRAKWGANFIYGSPNVDGHGHGTHCAGTVGGNTFGVAKKAKIVAVKVLDGNGKAPWSVIIAGLNWVAQNARGDRNVISLSIGGDRNEAVNRAVTDAYARGIFVAVAAGNENRDACIVSPASAVNSFTVGATDVYDRKASFSNWGECVDILAPGVDVLSAGIAHNRATQVMSGTSMAAPHVAGLASTLLSQGVTFSNLRSTLLNTGSKNLIRGFSRNTRNILANSGFTN